MPRALWSGTIAFGLVSVPVRLHPAVSQKEVRFHQLHDTDGGRVRQKHVCSVDGEEVPYERIVKGYEVSKNRYVTLTRDELKALEPEANRAIELERFVSLDEIDPIFYERTYYLAPDRGAAKAYALLLETLRESGRVGIGRMVMRTRKYLCALRPMGETLALSTMLFADEVIPKEKLELPRPPNLAKRELAMAAQLVDSLSEPFVPEDFVDDYRERVQTLLERKAEGEQIVAPPVAEGAAQYVDLIDALEASLAQRKKAPRAKTVERIRPIRHRAVAAKTARTRKPKR